MLCYNPDNDNLITIYSFDNTTIDDVDPETIFTVGSKWKDHSLLYFTVQAYVAATDWKPTLSHSI